MRRRLLLLGTLSRQALASISLPSLSHRHMHQQPQLISTVSSSSTAGGGGGGGVSYLTQSLAAQTDAELMQVFSTDQLMELAGLSVAQSIASHYSTTATTTASQLSSTSHHPIQRVVVVCGPGNNGGDGLVVARHLKTFAFCPDIVVVYPKLLSLVESSLYHRLVQQVQMCSIPVVTALPEDLIAAAAESRRRRSSSGSLNHSCSSTTTTTLVVDAIFGYSFKPGTVREPYGSLIRDINDSCCRVASIDIPSGWDVELGNQSMDDEEGSSSLRAPELLVSLMLPKLGVRDLPPTTAHYLGGRFVPDTFQKKYNLIIPTFPSYQQFVRLQ